MRLSAFSDYSLRLLIHLATCREDLCTIAAVAAEQGISEAHLMKVVHHLGRLGYIETIRGKGGGMRLGRQPQDIILGDVIRHTENDFYLAECFAGATTCRLHSACRLHGILDEALQAMFLVLDGYTLADLAGKPYPLPGAICADG